LLDNAKFKLSFLALLEINCLIYELEALISPTSLSILAELFPVLERHASMMISKHHADFSTNYFHLIKQNSEISNPEFLLSFSNIFNTLLVI
jgi:hypothetical protein